jgi:hypothetical protein
MLPVAPDLSPDVEHLSNSFNNLTLKNLVTAPLKNPSSRNMREDCERFIRHHSSNLDDDSDDRDSAAIVADWQFAAGISAAIWHRTA